MTTQLRALEGRARYFSSFLDTILDRAGITPIPDHLVEAYKEQELARAPKSDFIGRLLDKLSIRNNKLTEIVETLVLVACGVVVVGVIGVVSGGAHLVYHSLYNTASATWALYALGFGGGAALLGIFSVTVFYGIIGLDSRYILIGVGPARWVVVPAEDMLGSMPQFVYARMMCILGVDLDVRFEVADLRQNKYSLDPILYAVWGEERRAIDIWKDKRRIRLS